jgi:hypothetical protein
VFHLDAPLVGGLLIGLAVAMLLLTGGRMAGISGIVAGAIRPGDRERRWRGFFLAGMLVAGIGARLLAPQAFGAMAAPLPLLVLSGLLVGFGTRLGGGCTSGHGVCGVSRGSPRSIAATALFMAVAGVVVFVVRHGSVR